MASRNYIWLNGQFFDGGNPVINFGNRAFRYGDGVFETIHAFGTQPRHLHLHFRRLLQGMKILELVAPTWLTEQNLELAITKLLNKNRLFDSARVRVTVYRDDGGFYIPSTSNASVLIDTQPLAAKMYTLNQQGCIVGIYDEIKKPLNTLSGVKSCNALLFVKAGLYCMANNLDDCIILNEQGRVAEAISSNVFVVRGGKLYTPSLAEGCIPGIMRELVCTVAPTVGIEVNNQVAINPSAFDSCDEVFLTNAISGIKWVVGIGTRRYFNRVSRTLSEALNRFTFPDQFRAGFSG